MPRQQNALLSPAELNALRRVDSGLANFLPPAHKRVLIDMKLVAMTCGGRLVLTEAGRARLKQEECKEPSG